MDGTSLPIQAVSPVLTTAGPAQDTLGLSLLPPSPGASLSSFLDSVSSASSSSAGSPLLASPQLDVLSGREHDRRSSAGSWAGAFDATPALDQPRHLVEENAHLRTRIDDLEKLVVKLLSAQVTPAAPERLPTYSINDQLVVPAKLAPSCTGTGTGTGIDTTAWTSPLLLSSTAAHPARPRPSTASAQRDPTQDLTCHPAAMVTRSTPERALQRVSSRVEVLQCKERRRARQGRGEVAATRWTGRRVAR